MTLPIVLLTLAVVGVVGAVALGRITGGMDEPTSTVPVHPLPEGGLAAADLDQVRFAPALRGYRMDQVDATLDRLRDELARRDDELADLRGTRSEVLVGAGALAAPAGRGNGRQGRQAEPVVADPVVAEPVVVEPVANEPVANEPVANEPVANEPVVNEPVVNEPVADEPVADEPVADEPVNESAADEPPADEPVTPERGE